MEYYSAIIKNTWLTHLTMWRDPKYLGQKKMDLPKNSRTTPGPQEPLVTKSDQCLLRGRCQVGNTAVLHWGLEVANSRVKHLPSMLTPWLRLEH